MPLWLLSIISHWSFKTVSIILVLIMVGGGIYLYHRNGYNMGYNVGYSQSLKDNPPNIYTGMTTVNQQPCKAPSLVGIDIGGWGFGFIHRK